MSPLPSRSSSRPVPKGAQDLVQALAAAPPRVLVLAGGFGSGKTEVAVNLAIQLSTAGRRVQIADLDLVNPYFRCREARQLMQDHGVRVVVPEGAQVHADLPILLPEVAGMLRPPAGTLSLFDVGGEDDGARVLAALPIADAIEVWQVINARRPFTATVEGCEATRAAIEQASRQKVTGLLANTHLGEETTPEVVLQGWRLACSLAGRASLPLRGVAIMEHLAGSPELSAIDAPLLRLQRRMTPPWHSSLPSATPAPAPGDALPGERHG